MKRFPIAVDQSVFHDLYLFYLLARKEFLDHRTPSHLFRLVLSIHITQKELLRAEFVSSNKQELKIRWTHTNLLFPFSSKPVLGCLIVFNLMSRYDLFDEENILLSLQKYLPQLALVKKSSYHHNSQHKSLKTLYLEIEKKDGSRFSPLEQTLLKTNLEEKFKNSIQTLSPSVFMKINEEEAYKHILVLSQEIQSIHDFPQAYITFDQQTGHEILFRISLVYISPFHRFSLKERFFDCTFISERVSPVRLLDGHPIDAHIFKLSLPRDPSLLRSDGSLDFYSARRKVVALMTTAIGEFRDYNGGVLIKQQELLESLKERFAELDQKDPELLELFFYAIAPIEKQSLLSEETLSMLFDYFQKTRKECASLDSPYSLKIHRDDPRVFFVVSADREALNEIATDTLQSLPFRSFNLAYNILSVPEGTFFNCVLLQPKSNDAEILMQAIQDSLNEWHQKMKQKQILKIALEYSTVSLDPRIGGESVSGDILRFLFEGLTRFDKEGNIENGVAQSVEISPNLKQYIFRLRPSFWNDGAPVSAYDFEYSWKKILSPDFKTSFADLFFHIKNAKEAKEGKVSPDEIGIQVLDDRTLKVELVRPTPYFLQLITHPLFSPVHRIIDEQHPQWPYQAGKNYPCNGPFELKVNQPSQGYQLVKNPLYWNANQIKLDQAILTLMNPTQAIQAFQKKQVDWVGTPFGSWPISYNQGKGDQVLTFPNSWVVWNAFNTAVPPFSNKKIRQAFSYAVRRSQIIENSFMPLNPAHSILLPHYRKKNTSLFPEFNPDKARELFKEGLIELNMTPDDFPTFAISFLEKGIREYTANCLKQQFEECFPIKCDLDPLPWATLFKKMSDGDFHMGIVHWTSLVDDPVYTLNIYKSRQVEINFSKWEHPEFQRLLDLSEQEGTPFQRSLHLLQAEELLSQEMPVTPLFFQPCQTLLREDLNVFYRPPSGPFNPARSFYKSVSTKSNQ